MDALGEQTGFKSLFSLQGLNEQEVTLKQQVKDQAEKVKAAAPDAKTLKDLEKKVDAFQKGEFRK